MEERCLHPARVCDGFEDCSDGSDEPVDVSTGLCNFGLALGCGGDEAALVGYSSNGWPMPNPPSSGLPHPQTYQAGDVSVLDAVTGLVWQRVVEGEVTAGQRTTGPFTLAQAHCYCAELTLDGQSDWRLPSRIELISLVDYTRARPTIDTEAFPNTPSGSFWSSSISPNPSVERTVDAWHVDFYSGTANTNNGSFVRCVRGGANQEGQRFEAREGTITDRWTGLEWQQANDDLLYRWPEARDYCSSLTTASGGWRVPSLNELQTLVDESRRLPMVDMTIFLEAPPSEPGTLPFMLYWTSNPSPYKPAGRYYVDLNWGQSDASAGGVLGVDPTIRVRCVR